MEREIEMSYPKIVVNLADKDFNATKMTNILMTGLSGTNETFYTTS